MEETPALGAGNGTAIGATGIQNNKKTLMEYAQPSIDETISCIRKPTVQANNFELKPSYV